MDLGTFPVFETFSETFQKSRRDSRLKKSLEIESLESRFIPYSYIYTGRDQITQIFPEMSLIRYGRLLSTV